MAARMLTSPSENRTLAPPMELPQCHYSGGRVYQLRGAVYSLNLSHGLRRWVCQDEFYERTGRHAGCRPPRLRRSTQAPSVATYFRGMGANRPRRAFETKDDGAG